MMDVTDRHYRSFMRRLTRRTQLWTEMVVDDTILHQEHNLDRFLYFEAEQHPIVAQLGGSNPETLARAAEHCEAYGYDEVNLNCGCPSKRVSRRCFGARLMLDPGLVARCAKAMQRRCSTAEVTVKCRLGADDRDSYAKLCEFVHVVAGAGVRHFQIHARKCWLSGLSTKQNRSVPPLRYGWIRRLQRDFPGLGFSLNGGVKTMDEVSGFLHDPDQPPLRSVMLGRAAWHTPWIFAEADSRIFEDAAGDPVEGGLRAGVRGRCRVVREYLREYAALEMTAPRDSQRVARGKQLCVLKPLHAIFQGCEGNAQFKQALAAACRPPRAADGAKRGKRSPVDVAVLLERIEAAVNDVEALQARWEDAHGGGGALRPWPVG
jgi:tRNA-dihydrouridine synthase A